MANKDGGIGKQIFNGRCFFIYKIRVEVFFKAEINM